MELLFYYLIWSNSSPTIIPVSNAVFSSFYFYLNDYTEMKKKMKILLLKWNFTP